MNICLISCPNGYGHNRRVASIAKFLLDLNHHVHIISSLSSHIVYLLRKYSLHCSHHPISPLLTSSFWHSDLDFPYQDFPCLDHFDCVLSDNILEIIDIRNDTVISGSFFWHKCLKNVNTDKYNHAENILNSYKPFILSSSLFSPGYIRMCENYIPVGLYDSPTSCTKIPQVKDSLLFSVGKGGIIAKSTITEYLLSLIDSINSTAHLFIEPNLYKESFPSNVSPADYSSEMYARIYCAFVRPGIGTITDLIQNKSYCICFGENDNHEIEFNASVIQKLGIGVSVSNFREALFHYYDMFSETTSLPRTLLNTFSSISISGATDSGSFLLKN